MGYAVLIIDDLRVNGVSVDNGGFEDGDITYPWSSVGSELPTLIDSGFPPENIYEGSYSCALISNPTTNSSYCTAEYFLTSAASDDVITFKYQIAYSDNEPGNTVGIGAYIYGDPLISESYAPFSSVYEDGDSPATCDWTTCTLYVADTGATGQTDIYIDVYSWQESVGGGDAIEATIFFDDFGHGPGNTNINIEQTMHIRNQYDTANRHVDDQTTFQLKPLDTDITAWTFGHRLTDIGKYIGFDDSDMSALGCLHKVIGIYNILHMKVRRIK